MRPGSPESIAPGHIAAGDGVERVRMELAFTSGLRLGASLRPWDLRRLTLPSVTGDSATGDRDAGPEGGLALPEHLSALIGALHGPEDLGRHHDKYLTYPERDDVAGAASA